MHVLLRPAEGRTRAGLREGLSDGIDSLRRSRRARARGGSAYRGAARRRNERRNDLQSERVERRRHARIFSRARRPEDVQPSAESDCADHALEAGVECGRDRLGGHGARIAAGIRVRRAEVITESRLDQLRQNAVPMKPETGYYGMPLLKEPVWTWEVPAYFFVGGAAGAAAVVGAAAQVAGADHDLVNDARWIAAAGAALSGPLLIADLGRPERFLNMLRVFKVQSPMSVGAWTLTAFGTFASAALFADEMRKRTDLPVELIGDASAILSAATGLVMATYTGVLIGATAIPVWSKHVSVLPLHFGTSALASAVSMLELAGHNEQ